MKLRPSILLTALSSALLVFTSGVRAQTPLTILHSFGTTDGTGPYASLVQGSDGNLYGMTVGGGNAGSGTVFKITPAGSFTSLYSFTAFGSGEPENFDGNEPKGVLAIGSDGNFYGTTEYGGSGNGGTVFKITPSGTFSILHTFLGNEGASPIGGLIQASDGNFYGAAPGGGAGRQGTIFKMTSTGAVNAIYSFLPTTLGGNYFEQGANPEGALTQGSDGNFYGTTANGGTLQMGQGTIFKITSSGTLSSLHSFIESDGSMPIGGMIQGSDSYFYGTTYSGGSNHSGTVFKIKSDGTFTSLFSFSAAAANSGTNTYGSNPYAALIQATDGNFYGTTANGAAYGGGTIFKITPTGKLTTVYNFGVTSSDGYEPFAGLIEDSSGNFYGTTYAGGANGYGTIFKFSGLPVITSAATAEAASGRPFSYQITVTNSPTSFDATPLPSGFRSITARASSRVLMPWQELLRSLSARPTQWVQVRPT